MKRGTRLVRVEKKKQQPKKEVVVEVKPKKVVRPPRTHTPPTPPGPNPDTGFTGPWAELPRKTIYNGLGFSGVHSVTTYCDVVKFNYPGITENNNDKPLFCSSNYLEIYKSAPEDSEIAWDNIDDYEATDSQHEYDANFDYYFSKDGILANVFENGGCLFLYKEGTNDEPSTSSPNANYTYLIRPWEKKDDKTVIDYRTQTIYINCSRFKESGDSFEIIEPRKVRVYGVNVGNITFKFYSFNKPSEADEEYPNGRILQVMKKPFHFVMSEDPEERALGIGELVEGEPDGQPTPQPDDPVPQPPVEEDPFVPVDDEGNPIEGAERIVNLETEDDQALEHATVIIDGEEVEVDLRGAFPVTKLIESENATGAQGQLNRIDGEDDPEVEIEKYVMLYYIPGDKSVQYVLGNHFTVEDNEAVMLFKRIELYNDDKLGGLDDVVNRSEMEEYTFNVLYYNNPATGADINQYHEMKYKNLLIDTFVNANIKVVDGTLHIYKFGLLSCKKKLKSGRFEKLDLYVNKDCSVIYPDGQLTCSDIIQIEM